MVKKSHYSKLKHYLPSGYLIEIANITGSSISLVNKVLREERPDKRGILAEAYRIANEEKSKQEKNAKNLAYFEFSLDQS